MEKIKKVIEWVNKWPVAKWLMLVGTAFGAMTNFSVARRLLRLDYPLEAGAQLVAAAAAIYLAITIYKTVDWWKTYLGVLIVRMSMSALAHRTVGDIVVIAAIDAIIAYAFYRWDLIQRDPKKSIACRIRDWS